MDAMLTARAGVQSHLGGLFMLPRVCVFLVAALCAGRPAVAADAESEILEAEKSWAAAVKALDLDALGAMLHEDMFYAHSTGKVDSRKQYLDNFATGAARYDVIDYEQTKVTLLGDAAIGHSRVAMKGQSPDGPFDVYLMMIHVWVRWDDGWQLAAHQTTRLERP
jgi:ketosteroid isomerase-like protein